MEEKKIKLLTTKRFGGKTLKDIVNTEKDWDIIQGEPDSWWEQGEEQISIPWNQVHSHGAAAAAWEAQQMGVTRERGLDASKTIPNHGKIKCQAWGVQERAFPVATKERIFCKNVVEFIWNTECVPGTEGCWGCLKSWCLLDGETSTSMDREEEFQLGGNIWNWDPMVRLGESGSFSNFKARRDVQGWIL